MRAVQTTNRRYSHGENISFRGQRAQKFTEQETNKGGRGGAEAVGAEVTLMDLVDFEMPLFGQDLEGEQGMPDDARTFKQLMIKHDGFMVASPEYNSASSPLLKNSLDGASR